MEKLSASFLLGEYASTTNELPNKTPKLPNDDNGYVDPLTLSEEDNLLKQADNASGLSASELDPLDEANLIEYAAGMNVLSENMNIVRLNHQAKLKNLSSRTAIVLARQANDPLYEKYTKFNALRISLRNQIFKKYGTRAASYARKIMSSAGSPSTPASSNATSKR